MGRLRVFVVVVGVVVLGVSAGLASSVFSDVPAGRYYSDAVDWAFDNGVTTGTSASTFSPEDPVTRGQNVTFAYRYDQNVVQPAFEDVVVDIVGLTNSLGSMESRVTAAENEIDVLETQIAGLETPDSFGCGTDQVLINDDEWRCANPVVTRSSYAVTVNRTLVTAGNVGLYSSVAIGVDGNPVISHSDNTNFDLELYVCDDPTCASGTNQTLVTEGFVGEYSSVVIGADGNPIIGHYDVSNTDLELAVPGFTVTGLVFE